MIPVLVLVFYLLPMDVRYLAAAFVFSIASLTDWLDGYLARSMGQTTPFGAFLDPVADKLLVAVALILLVEVHASALLAIPALVIVGREIVVSALREWMSQYSDLGGVKVSMIAKVKTGFQMTAIIVLLSQPPSLDNLLVILGFFAALRCCGSNPLLDGAIHRAGLARPVPGNEKAGQRRLMSDAGRAFCAHGMRQVDRSFE